MRTPGKLHLALFVLLALLLAAAPVFANATISIVNVNAPGVGFNDPTPRAPVGGNPGTTLGQQRLIAFQHAASIWSSILDSAVPIYIQAQFTPLGCTATTAVLGAAGASEIFANFPGAPKPNTWYHVALANRLAFGDLDSGPNGTDSDDMVAFFNSNIGLPGCLTGNDWYYGLDDNHGTKIDLVTVLLHEFGHGLGFSAFFSKATGALLGPPFFDDIYERFLFDTTTGLHYDAMTNAQRATSTLNSQRVVWDGPQVTAKVPTTLAAGTPLLAISAPASLAGNLSVGTAAFGPPLASPGLTGSIVAGLDPADGAGPSTLDGCSAFTNAAAVAGKIALVSRGTCGFIVKVKNAQNAGAVGAIIADNVAGSPPAGLGGVDPTITIPSIRITLNDGNAIRTALTSGPVSVTLGVNLAVRAGADASGRALVFTPNPLQGGSSISHWDTSAFPNLLMEPAINADLTHGVDLTLPLLRDIGWAPDADLDGVADDQDQCLHSILTSTVIVDACDSGVHNTLFTNGCTISDQIAQCAAGAHNHGGFVSCVSHLTNDLKKDGVISGSDKGSIQSCAGGARIP
ncbi:MAG TPA: PA domain-containing protein [Thermoanaerobaculia bacterium]|nr:PA domain-containing protein [Thermoanaerobaculia bacterium]